MRQEEKEIDGADLEQAEERKRENELVEEHEDELYDLDGLPEHELDEGRSSVVLSAMRAILEGDELVINDLDLSQRHLTALEALKTAADGKDSRLAKFVYAEDRRQLLEQALAVLQPELASMDNLSDEFHTLLQEVGELRETLSELEDAEDEIDEFHRAHHHGKPAGAADTDDEDDDDDDGKGDEDDDTSLTGPPRKLPPRPATSLTGPERKPEPKPATSLTGPERKPEPKGPTTLGDPAEIAEAASRERAPGD